MRTRLIALSSVLTLFGTVACTAQIDKEALLRDATFGAPRSMASNSGSGQANSVQDNTRSEQDGAFNSDSPPAYRAADGKLLPPGVRPPNNPPQPGDAPLGPDGHYNYNSPEFVLDDPCENPELINKLSRTGWILRPEIDPNLTGYRSKGCLIYSKRNLHRSMGLISYSATSNELLSRASQISNNYQKSNYAHVIPLESPMGKNCIAVIETPRGSVGIVQSVGDYQRFVTQSQACNEVAARFDESFGEN